MDQNQKQVPAGICLFFLEPERFEINFLLTGRETGILKSQINFVHKSFFTVNCAVFKYGNLFAACAITKCHKCVCIFVPVQTSRTDNISKDKMN